MSPVRPTHDAVRPGPRPRLSRAAIIEAALQDGIEDVTMQTVARRLSTSPSALYRYVDSHEELLAAALGELLRRTPLPSAETGWRSLLEAEAALLWDVLTSHAGVALADPHRLETVSTDRMVATVEALQERGLSVEDAVLAVDAVLDLVHDGAAQAARLPDPGTPAPEALRRRLETCPPATRAAIEAIVADPHAHVERKLALILDGLQARLDAQAQP
ncbi:TetR family transcriptional regulator [Conexibacter woesei]|uniref:Regulatory protein TetR n=1 Tax=Conexibacter woesei (strain DSM 14684 / CCUG 47730 / CIP 108061 / JCM 11494 / NBRC 100937 / ID131577) TaxID=469383 RepID=D3F5H6_CONWI|nr:TetR family transcriptional regulator [Conexibacter woesei]ADB50643.1 regulatory protein TetR [Conexibacter woesei DSM 14684]